MQSLISIVMPVYNSEKYIEEAISSVIEQSYSYWELLIVNDGSTDGSAQLINKYMERDQRIKLIDKKENEGVALARNCAIKAAQGDYICFLDSDDVWEKNKLEIQISYMKKKDVSFSCTSYSIINEKGDKVGYFERKQRFYDYDDLLRTNFIGCLTVMTDAKMMKKNLMPNVKHEDYATWLNILSSGERILFIEETLAIYRKVSGSISSNKIQVISWTWKIFSSQKRLTKMQQIIYFVRYMCVTIYKYISFGI